MKLDNGQLSPSPKIVDYATFTFIIVSCLRDGKSFSLDLEKPLWDYQMWFLMLRVSQCDGPHYAFYMVIDLCQDQILVQQGVGKGRLLNWLTKKRVGGQGIAENS